MAEPFRKKFIEGPFAGLCFRSTRNEANSTIELEFWNGRKITISMPDYNQWKETDVPTVKPTTLLTSYTADDALLRAWNKWLASVVCDDRVTPGTLVLIPSAPITPVNKQLRRR